MRAEDKIDVILVDAPGIYEEKFRQHLFVFAERLKKNPRLVVSIGTNVNNEKGLTVVRNEVLRATHQKYVFFMDFDFALDTFNIQWERICDILDGDIGCVNVNAADDGQGRAEIEDTFFYSCHVMAFRRDVAEALGPFDERFRVFQADLDTLRRVWEMGLRVVQHNFSTVQHLNFSHTTKDRNVIHKADCLAFIAKFKNTIWKTPPSHISQSVNQGFIGVYDEDGGQVRHRLPGFVSYLKRNNEVRIYAGEGFSEPWVFSQNTPFRRDKGFWVGELWNCRHLFLWTGWGELMSGAGTAREVCEEMGIPYSYIGPGWIIPGTVSLLPSSGVWSGEMAEGELHSLNETHFQGKHWLGKLGAYTLIPIPAGIEIRIASSGKIATAQDYVRFCERKFGAERIVFQYRPGTVHGLSGNGRSELTTAPFLDVAIHASKVYALDHMTAIESSKIGVPTETYEPGLFDMVRGKSDEERQKVFLALADATIPSCHSELDYWLKYTIRADAHVHNRLVLGK